jgi:hypothetical protein
LLGRVEDMTGFCPSWQGIVDGQECTRRAKRVRAIDVKSGSSKTGSGLGAVRAKRLAKLGCPIVGLGYDRVDREFRSAEDRFQNLLQGVGLVLI